MSDPSVSITVLDGQLGESTGNAVGTMFALGTSTAGTVDTVYASGSTTALAAALGEGKLVEGGSNLISKTGGHTHFFIPLLASIAGTNSSVTKSNGASPTVSLSGTPVNDFSFILIITTGGARGTAQFKYSSDGGDSYSPVFTTAATFVASTSGLTINFATGTNYTAGDTYTWTCVAPGYGTTDLGNGLTAMLNSLGPSVLAEGCWATGLPADAATTAAMAAVVDSALVDAEADFVYMWGVVESPLESNASDAQLETAFASFASRRTNVAGGTADVFSDLERGAGSRSSSANGIVPRIAGIPISQDPGWVGAPQGSIPGINTGSTRAGQTNGLWRDEGITSGLYDARFWTLRTFKGRAGIYCTGCPTMAPAGSDFSQLPNRRVMDQSCRALYQALLPFLNSAVNTAPGGTIDPNAATAISTHVEAQVQASVQGQLSTKADGSPAVTVTIGLTNIILDDSTLYVTVSERPKGYARDIVSTIGFSLN